MLRRHHADDDLSIGKRCTRVGRHSNLFRKRKSREESRVFAMLLDGLRLIG
jgi:hypothetical protein